ncbi:MAG: hypothetical protein AAGD11_16835 [Planctomycetota bacterium]
MSLISRLESRFGRWAIPNVTAIIIAGQVLLYFAIRFNPNGQGIQPLMRILFLPGQVLEGEVWRIFTFVFYPPIGSPPIFVLFYWFLLYRYGTALEATWGTFRYNCYLLIAIAAHFAAALLIWSRLGDAGVLLAQIFATDRVSIGFRQTNVLLFGTVFLAFARYFPDYILHAFFVLPIRIFWLALVMWIGYAYVLLIGDWPTRLLVGSSLLNYLIFFGRGHWRDWKHGQRRRAFESKVKAASKAILHQCEVCEKNSENSPKTLFRYCSKCEGQRCYCPDHIQDHECVVS